MRSVLRAGAIYLFVWSCFGWADGVWRPECQAQSNPAVINVRTDPPVPRTGENLRLLFDLAGDAVRAEIKWVLNGKEVGTSDFDFVNKTVELNQPIKVGDVIGVTVTPYDAGGTAGIPVDRRIICRNSPPDVKVTNEQVRGDLYTAKIEATDPEGGPVKLTLEEGPPGLKMDDKGNIEWKLAKNNSGKFEVKVVAEDDQGQRSFFSYEVGIKWRQ